MASERLTAVAKWTDLQVASDAIERARSVRAAELERWWLGSRRKLVVCERAPRAIGWTTGNDALIRTTNYAVVFVRSDDQRAAHVLTSFPWAHRHIGGLPQLSRRAVRRMPELAEFARLCAVEHREATVLDDRWPWGDLFDPGNSLGACVQLLMGIDAEVVDEPRDADQVLHHDLGSWSALDLLAVAHQVESLIELPDRDPDVVALIVASCLLLSDDWMGFDGPRELLGWLAAGIREHRRLAQPDSVSSSRPSSSDDAAGTM